MREMKDSRLPWAGKIPVEWKGNENGNEERERNKKNGKQTTQLKRNELFHQCQRRMKHNLCHSE